MTGVNLHTQNKINKEEEEEKKKKKKKKKKDFINTKKKPVHKQANRTALILRSRRFLNSILGRSKI